RVTMDSSQTVITPTTNIYLHANPVQSILPALRAHMPYSIPVYRRIQSTQSYPSSTAVVLATFPPTIVGGIGNDKTKAGRAVNAPLPSLPSSSTWLVAWVDLFLNRETQVCVYSSLEMEATTKTRLTAAATGPATTAVSRN